MSFSQIRCIAQRVCKLRMGFSVPSIIWVGVELMQITRQRTRPAWPAKTKSRMTLNCSKIGNEIALMSGIFVEGRRQTLLYSCKRQYEISEKSSKKTSQLLPETGRSQATNLETQKQTKWIEIHRSQVNMRFLRGPLRWMTEQKNPNFHRSFKPHSAIQRISL